MTQTPLAPGDVEAAGRIPCLLADGATDVVAPWPEALGPRDHGEFVDLLWLLERSAHRLALLAMRDLPAEDAALVAALTVRAWSLGVADSAGRLASGAGAESAHDDWNEAVRSATGRLRVRYDAAPSQVRRDGLDLLAGSLLDG